MHQWRILSWQLQLLGDLGAGSPNPRVGGALWESPRAEVVVLDFIDPGLNSSARPIGRIIRPAARRTVAAADVPLHNSDFEVSNSSDSVSPQQRRRGVRKSELSTVPHPTPCSWQSRFRSKAVLSSTPAASSERIRASRPPRCTTTTTSRCQFSRPRSPNARPAAPASDSPIHASSPEVRKVESSVANMQRVKKSRET